LKSDVSNHPHTQSAHYARLSNSPKQSMPNSINKKRGLPTGTLPVCKNPLLALCLPTSSQGFLKTGLPHTLPYTALWHLDGSAKIQH